MTDWADDLAAQIAADMGARPTELEADIVAAKLRFLRHQGVGEGIQQCRAALGLPPKEDEHADQR